jgi:polyhydroxybutyrate depolymerase
MLLLAAVAAATWTGCGVTLGETRDADCIPPRPHNAGRSDGTITSGSRIREYVLHVPSSYTGEDALPLVLDFHGFGGEASQHSRYTGFPAKGEEEGFIVVTPQGAGGYPFWNASGVATLQNDVSFIRDLIDETTQDLCVDEERVYAVGISNGGAMSSYLACRLSDRVSAVGAVAGISFPRHCSGSRSVPVIAFHGTGDKTVPFEGGEVWPLMSEVMGLEGQPVEDTVAAWADQNECEGGPAMEVASPRIRRALYEGCSDGAHVEFYEVRGGGHTWPGGVDVPRLGFTTHEIDATDLIWHFFEGHPMPSPTPAP